MPGEIEIRWGTKHKGDSCEGQEGGLGRRTFLGLTAALAAEAALGGVARAGSCGAPPPAKPHRWTGGESFPPLPLPVTPLRRSEKKRPPAPPALIGKVQYGKVVQATAPDGRKYTYRDWTTDPADTTQLMQHVKHSLKLDYRGVHVDLNSFSWDPKETPILYLTGHEGFEFSAELRRQLRLFLNDGGYLLGDACCGMEDFKKAFMEEMNHLFPRKKMHVLPPDHPVHESFYRIEEVGYEADGKGFRGPPVLMGIELGCRMAVCVSPYDLSCGWDLHRHDQGQRVWSRVHGHPGWQESVQLGVNYVAYALAGYQLGKQLSTHKLYHEAGASEDTKFSWGQVIHGGDWDPDPDAAANLLKYVGANSTLPVKFKKAAVDLARLNTFAYPFLYLTGHHDFTFTDAERENLKRYLKGGGILLADACCGRRQFDAAFRRELQKVLGEPLQELKPEHAVFSSGGHQIRSVAYSPRVTQHHPGLTSPKLEGVAMAGTTAVFYSRFDLGCAWEQIEHPYALGYSQEDGLRLGLNILSYAMTH